MHKDSVFKVSISDLTGTYNKNVILTVRTNKIMIGKVFENLLSFAYNLSDECFWFKYILSGPIVSDIEKNTRYLLISVPFNKTLFRVLFGSLTIELKFCNRLVR